MIGDTSSPLAIADKKPAFTYAASSTPGGTRSLINSNKNDSSPAGGFFNNSIKSVTCSGLSGLGGIPSAARSATCSRYCCNTTASSHFRTCPPCLQTETLKSPQRRLPVSSYECKQAARWKNKPI